jgi:hypothetical protein
MPAPNGRRGVTLLQALCALMLSDCAPLIGLDEDYHVAAGHGFVIPPGKLVFHRYSDYRTGDSEMFVVSFPDLALIDIKANYDICNPVNGIFSPDGKTLAVTAEPPANPCPATAAAQQDVYLLDLLNPGMMLKVTGNTLPDEDPQFDPTGDFILFKHDKHLARWYLGDPPFTDCQILTGQSACFASSSMEQSKPVMTPPGMPTIDGEDVCYYDLFHAQADILCFNLREGLLAPDINAIATRVVQHPNISDARPNFSADYLYFVRWNDEENPITMEYPKDRIARRPLPDLQNSADDYPVFAVDLASDYSDPFSIDGDLVIFSSSITGEGLHDLFIGDWSSADLPRSLNEWIVVNTEKEELGGVFWRAP